MKNLSLLALMVLVLFSACRKDVDKITDEVVVPTPPTVIDDYTPTMDLITGTVTGVIYNEQNEPIENAVINLRGTNYTTDDEGLFVAKDVQLDAEGTFYTVEKDGYFKGSRRFYPREGAISYTRVQMMELNSIGTFAAADGANLTSSEELEISFPANAIRKADGTLYSGTVDVAARWLNPSADNVGELMPGALFGLNSRVEEVSLATYGMMAVELFGENGEALNIAEGKKAQLSFPLPADLVNSAPDEIPLWSFEDEQYGIWVEEGSATLNNGKYVGEVSHFSFWNCDAPFPIVFIEGRLVTSDGTPIADATVKVRVVSSGICRWGNTDSDGYFSGKMPKDEELEITANAGGAVCDFANSLIGPFDMDTNIGDLTLLDSGSSFEVTGSVVDCDGNPVTDGRVKVVVGDQLTTFYLDGSNTFTMAVLNCDNETDFTVRVDDLVNEVGSDAQTFTIAPLVDVGAQAACGNVITEYFTMTINGESVTYYEGDIRFEIPNSATYMYMFITDPAPVGSDSTSFSLSMINGAVGTYDATGIDNLSIVSQAPNFSNDLNFYCWNQGGTGTCVDNLTAFTMNITVNEGLGGNLEANLSGTADFTDQMGNTVPNVDFSASWRLPIVQ